MIGPSLKLVKKHILNVKVFFLGKTDALIFLIFLILITLIASLVSLFLFFPPDNARFFHSLDSSYMSQGWQSE